MRIIRGVSRVIVRSCHIWACRRAKSDRVCDGQTTTIQIKQCITRTYCGRESSSNFHGRHHRVSLPGQDRPRMETDRVGLWCKLIHKNSCHTIFSACSYAAFCHFNFTYRDLSFLLLRV